MHLYPVLLKESDDAAIARLCEFVVEMMSPTGDNKDTRFLLAEAAIRIKRLIEEVHAER